MAVTTIRPGRTFSLTGLVLGALALAVALAMLLPVAYLALRTFEQGGHAWDVITRDTTVDAAIRTVWFSLAVAVGAIGLAVPVAWLTARTDLPFRKAWFVLLALPLTIPSYIGAFAFVAALGPRGIVQGWLEPLGVERLPEIYGFTGAWLVLTLFTYPYVLLPVRSALLGVDRSLEEASRSLGRGSLVTFARVTLPQLRPAVATGALLAVLYALSDFGAVSILRFDSLSRIIHLQYSGTFDRGAAASVALVLVCLAVAVVGLESLSRGRARYHTTSVGRQPNIVRLGHWRWPALAFCLVLALVALGVPLGVLSYWLVRGLRAGEAVGSVWTEASHSLYVSALAAMVAVVVSLPVAYLAARRPGLRSSLLEKVSYTGYALPGLTVALALVFFGARYAPTLYQTLPLLIFAYVVLFLPQAVGSCRSSFLQVNPKTEEASRSLGKGGPATFVRVTLPQLLPGVGAAGGLVFLTVMKELPATLILSPIGYSTLATRVWSSSQEAFFARAALPALLLVLLSSIPMLLLVLRERRLT